MKYKGENKSLKVQRSYNGKRHRVVSNGLQFFCNICARAWSGRCAVMARILASNSGVPFNWTIVWSNMGRHLSFESTYGGVILSIIRLFISFRCIQSMLRSLGLNLCPIASRNFLKPYYVITSKSKFGGESQRTSENFQLDGQYEHGSMKALIPNEK